MSAPQIKGLAGALRDLRAFSAKTSDLAQKVSSTLSEGSGTIAQVEATHKEISNALAEVKAELGAVTNGGPPLDDPFSAAPTATAPASGQPDAGQFNNPPLQH